MRGTGGIPHLILLVAGQVHASQQIQSLGLLRGRTNTDTVEFCTALQPNPSNFFS